MSGALGPTESPQVRVRGVVPHRIPTDKQFRGLQQFFKWLAAEEEIPDPMTGLRPPHVPDQPVPVFSGGDLARLERACAGRSFQQRRDAAMIAVFRATGGAPVGTGGHPLGPG